MNLSTRSNFAGAESGASEVPASAHLLMKRRIFTGTLSTTVNSVVKLFVAFFVTPIVIYSIGMEAYGLWAVVGSAVSYFAVLDCGIGSGFVKFLAEYLERNERHNIRQVMTFGFVFYSGLGMMLVPLAWFLAPHVVHYLKVAPRYHDDAVNLLILAVLYFAISSALGMFSSLLGAMQRTDITGVLDMVYQAVYAVALLTMLFLHWGVYALPLAIFVALGVTTLIKLGLVHKMFGNPWSNPFQWERQVIRRLFRFGFWTQISSLTVLVNAQTDRLILGAFVSVTSVGYYELGNRLASLARMFPIAFLIPLFPAASAIEGRGDRQRLGPLYIRATRYLALMTFLISGFLVGTGPLILKIWMGRQYPDVIAVMDILLISYAFYNLTGVGTLIVRATAQPEYETYYSVLSAVVNIVATIILTPMFGILGVVGGTAIGYIVGSCFFFWIFHNLSELRLAEVVSGWLWRLTAGIGGATILLWMSAANLIPALWLTSRAHGVLALAILGGGYLAITGALLLAVGFWNLEDLNLLRHVGLPFLSRTGLKIETAGT